MGFWELMGPSLPHKYVTWQVNHCKEAIKTSSELISHIWSLDMHWERKCSDKKKVFKWNGVRWMMARHVTFCSEQTGDVQSDRLDSRRLHLTYRKNSGLDIQWVFLEDKKWDGSDELEWNKFHQYKRVYLPDNIIHAPFMSNRTSSTLWVFLHIVIYSKQTMSICCFCVQTVGCGELTPKYSPN